MYSRAKSAIAKLSLLSSRPSKKCTHTKSKFNNNKINDMNHRVYKQTSLTNSIKRISDLFQTLLHFHDYRVYF